MEIKDYKILPIDKATEVEFIKKWHYSRKVVPNSVIRFGCFNGMNLIGVATFGRIINCKPIFSKVSNRGGLELNRLALVDEAPKNSESWFLMTCIKILSKKYKWLKFIHTWADGLRCNGGVIYKACGFLYLRKIPIQGLYLLPNGEVMHQITFDTVYLPKYYKQISEVSGRVEKVQVVFGPNVKELSGGFQYHYVYLLDRSIKDQLLFVPQPYETNMRQ